MIIFSQDKTSITNFNNLVAVYIDEVLTGPEDVDRVYSIKTHALVCVNGGLDIYNVTLANYSTMERAKEVLEKMINAIGLGMYKYDMPQK